MFFKLLMVFKPYLARFEWFKRFYDSCMTSLSMTYFEWKDSLKPGDLILLGKKESAIRKEITLYRPLYDKETIEFFREIMQKGSPLIPSKLASAPLKPIRVYELEGCLYSIILDIDNKRDVFKVLTSEGIFYTFSFEVDPILYSSPKQIYHIKNGFSLLATSDELEMIWDKHKNNKSLVR